MICSKLQRHSEVTQTVNLFCESDGTLVKTMNRMSYFYYYPQL
jgi:hypothetical protein